MVLSNKFSLGTESVVQFIARTNQQINHFPAIMKTNCQLTIFTLQRVFSKPLNCFSTDPPH